MRNFTPFLFLITAAAILAAGVLYYPKWKQNKTEAAISWDVSGYYLYLPAAFIYNDIKQVGFLEKIIDQYQPTPDPQQVFRHESGNRVMKYSLGQAIHLAPWFFLGHIIASNSSIHPADGFSTPYQFAIGTGSLLYALFGLYFLIIILRDYFNDTGTALSVLSVVLGSNFLEYGAISSAMTHSTLFTNYCLLIFFTIRFYRKPGWGKAFLIGLLVGLNALTRPTEIIALLIPVLWNIRPGFGLDMIGRLYLFKKHWWKMLLAIITTSAIGFLQLGYWKYVSGDWFVYSYQDQGFSWLKPHIMDGLFSYKSGWLTYSPVMIFALMGFYHLYKNYRHLFLACFAFTVMFIYIAFAWDIWWYGGALGQRAMVQCYPILAFPMAAFYEAVFKRKYWRIPVSMFLGLCIVYNIWLTHQAHKGGLLRPGHMTKAYFFHILGKKEISKEAHKLLDTRHIYTKPLVRPVTLLDYHAETDPETDFCTQKRKQLCLTGQNQYSKVFSIPVAGHDYKWMRVTAEVSVTDKEFDIWKMTQLTVQQKFDGKARRTRMIRLQRHINPNETKKVYIDVKKPRSEIDEIVVYLWLANSTKPVGINQIIVQTH